MSTDPTSDPAGRSTDRSSWRSGRDLFLISLLILFLELACIRWFPAHVVFLTFFTNTVLLACFLGMSVGCLAASRSWSFLSCTPLLLVIALATAHGVEYLQNHRVPSFLSGILPDYIHIQVGDQKSPQLVFFGTEDPGTQDLARFPVEALGGFYFLLIALALVGPGQELGRAFNRMPNRVLAYTVNILGSVIGIALFAACSWFELPPLWWFLPIAVGIAYFLGHRSLSQWAFQFAALTTVVWLSVATSGSHLENGALISQHLWSPYYRIDYDHEGTYSRFITVNLIGHQQMRGRDDDIKIGPAYALPHLLHRDAQRFADERPKPFEDVLIIGAGSGNDISRALQWGAKHVDAVEIDPVIQRLGMEHHPDRPYQDPRVTRHVDDGRNFLRSLPADKKYDLILYALVDSLVLHSSYSNLRLESYLFTEQAFWDVERHLKKPAGVFVMYNYFRQGWIVARLYQGLEKVFGTHDPLVLMLPYEERTDEEATGGFTMFLAGDTQRFQEAFRRHPRYWLREDLAPQPETTPNGFEQNPKPEEDHWQRFGLAGVIHPANMKTASDDWPFLYLRQPMIPDLTWRGMAIMGGLSLILILLFLPSRRGQGWRFGFNGRMFFLGAGFMLIETKAVVHMALLFGSTWMVNSVVFFAVLVMILAANLYVLAVRPVRLWPYYAGLLAALAINVLVPLDWFLGMERSSQLALSCLLVFAPILFAGVIFAVSFGRSTEPDRDFGANIAGAILGGLAENTSMLLGFQYLVLVALAFYVLSAVLHRQQGQAEPALSSLAEVGAN